MTGPLRPSSSESGPLSAGPTTSHATERSPLPRPVRGRRQGAAPLHDPYWGRSSRRRPRVGRGFRGWRSPPCSRRQSGPWARCSPSSSAGMRAARIDRSGGRQKGRALATVRIILGGALIPGLGRGALRARVDGALPRAAGLRHRGAGSHRARAHRSRWPDGPEWAGHAGQPGAAWPDRATGGARRSGAGSCSPAHHPGRAAGRHHGRRCRHRRHRALGSRRASAQAASGADAVAHPQHRSPAPGLGQSRRPTPMQSALARVRLVRVDLEVFHEDLDALKIPTSASPALLVSSIPGCATGLTAASGTTTSRSTSLPCWVPSCAASTPRAARTSRRSPAQGCAFSR